MSLTEPDTPIQSTRTDGIQNAQAVALLLNRDNELRFALAGLYVEAQHRLLVSSTLRLCFSGFEIKLSVQPRKCNNPRKPIAAKDAPALQVDISQRESNEVLRFAAFGLDISIQPACIVSSNLSFYVPGFEITICVVSSCQANRDKAHEGSPLRVAQRKEPEPAEDFCFSDAALVERSETPSTQSLMASLIDCYSADDARRKTSEEGIADSRFDERRHCRRLRRSRSQAPEHGAGPDMDYCYVACREESDTEWESWTPCGDFPS